MRPIRTLSGSLVIAKNCEAYDALIGLPERAPHALLADKGHNIGAMHADYAAKTIKAVIPGGLNRRVKSTLAAIFPPTQPHRTHLGLPEDHLCTAGYWFKFVHAAEWGRTGILNPDFGFHHMNLYASRCKCHQWINLFPTLIGRMVHPAQ